MPVIWKSETKHVEWLAWQAIVGELRRLGIDINETDELADRLYRWRWISHEADLCHVGRNGPLLDNMKGASLDDVMSVIESIKQQGSDVPVGQIDKGRPEEPGR